MRKRMYVGLVVFAAGLAGVLLWRSGRLSPEVSVQIAARPALDRGETKHAGLAQGTPQSRKRVNQDEKRPSREGSAEFAAQGIGQPQKASKWPGDSNSLATAERVIGEVSRLGKVSPAMADRVQRAFHLGATMQRGIDHIKDPETQRSRQENLLEQVRVRLSAAFPDEAMKQAALSVVDGLPRIERIEQ